MFVKLSSSEALKRDEKSRDLMAGMLFESLFLLHSGQKDIAKIVTFLSLYFFLQCIDNIFNVIGFSIPLLKDMNGEDL